jgi:hypothetical protein
MEVILHEHDFFSLWVVGTQLLPKAVVVGPGPAGAAFEQALADAGLGGRQQAGGALAYICAAFAPGPPGLGRLVAYSGAERALAAAAP